MTPNRLLSFSLNRFPSLLAGGSLIIHFSLFCLLLCASAATAGETPAIDMTCERPEIVITPNRYDTPKQDVAANVSVVTQEEIKKIPASNVAEVIQYIPGVYMEFNGGLGSEATASILGSDTRQVAVYQDGVPLNMLANPRTDLSYIPLASVERIEVYKGPASSAWGSSLGGVINIITKEPHPTKPFTAELQSSYGEFQTTRNNAAASGTIDRFGYLVSLTHDQSDGFVPHSEYRQEAVYTKLNYFLGESSRINFVYSYDEGRHKSPTALLADLNFWEDFPQLRTYQRLLYETNLLDNLVWTIEGRHHEFEISDNYNFVDSWMKGFDYSENQWGFSTRMRYDIKNLNHLLLGFDGDWGEYDFSSYVSRFRSGNWAFYANDTVDIGAFSLIAGLRYDQNLDFGSEISPSGGVVYLFPWMGALARAQVSRGFSAPPGAWVNDPTYGNKDLKAETGVNYQLGAEIKPCKFLKMEMNLFRAEIDNLINFDLVNYKWMNIDSAVRRGFEGRIAASFDSGPASGLNLSFGGSLVEVSDGTTGEIIKNIPQVLLDASASYTYKRITNSIIGRYIFNNSTFPETHDRVFIFDYLVKAKLPFPYQFCTPNVFLAVHNLTNSGYLFRAVFPQPGRWFEGGVKLEF